MRLVSVLHARSTFVLENAASRDAVLARVANVGHVRLPEVPEAVLLSGFVEREAKFPTATPEQVAFPHVLLPSIPETFVVGALLRPGVRWGTGHHPPQDLVFAIFGHSDKPWEHVRLLARLARVARGAGALPRLRASVTAEEFHQVLLDEDARYG